MLAEREMSACGDCPFAPECRTRAGLGDGQRLIYYRGRYWSDASWAKIRRIGPGGCEASGRMAETGPAVPNRDQGLKTAEPPG